MQVKNLLLKLGPLSENIYLDEAGKKVYVSDHEILKSAGFATWIKEVERLTGSRFHVEVDANRVRRERATQLRGFSSEEEGLNELTNLIRFAVKERVSDIHIENKRKENRCVVCFRVDGFLKEVKRYSYEEGSAIIRAAYNNCEEVSDPTFNPNAYQYGQLTKANIIPQEVEAIRIQRGPESGGEFMVLRILYRESHINLTIEKTFDGTLKKSFSNYGYSPWTIERLGRVIKGAEGLTIISGPTGSGKSTALKLMLEIIHLLYPYKSIFTIEDPPEYIIKGAKQLPVPSRGSFAEVLRIALRSDPDIIMVGEVREENTARTVINAVLTGHQVFTTLHAKDVPTILTRLEKLGVEINDIIENDVIKLLISQRLVPRLCPHCRKKINHMGRVFYVSEGCKACDNTGVKGRVIVEESLSLQDLRYIGWKGMESAFKIKEFLKQNAQDLLGKAIGKALGGEISPFVVQAYVEYFDEEDISRVEKTILRSQTA